MMSIHVIILETTAKLKLGVFALENVILQRQELERRGSVCAAHFAWGYWRSQEFEFSES